MGVPQQVTPSRLGYSNFQSLFSHHSSKTRHSGWAGPLSQLMSVTSPCHRLKALPGAAGAQQPGHSLGLESSVTQMYAQALGTFPLVSTSLPSLVLVLCPAFSIICPDSCITSSPEDAKRNFFINDFKNFTPESSKQLSAAPECSALRGGFAGVQQGPAVSWMARRAAPFQVAQGPVEGTGQACTISWVSQSAEP